MMTSEGKILIVDDVLSNISVLFEFLVMHGHEVLVAQDGESALEIVNSEMPDLILLDVMMPGMDGFEVCRRLKANPMTNEIPVIFMTALTHTSDKLQGFDAGAVDYVTKPVQQEELVARVHAHLTIRQLQKKLQQSNEAMVARNAELDAFAHTVAHDLKNPAHGIIGFADIMRQSYAECLGDQGLSDLNFILESGHKMVNIIEALLMLAGTARSQHLSIEALDSVDILQQVQQRLLPMIEEYQAQIKLPEQWPVAYGYAPWVEEIWANYLSNALKYGGKPPKIQIGAEQLEDKISFWIKDNGAGLTQAQQDSLFTPFTRLHQEQIEGHGLGLTIVQRIVSKLQGEVKVESETGRGSTFFFTLPAQPPADF